MGSRYQTKPYDPVILKRLQNAQLEIVKDFADLCDRHGLDYFAVYGTALGAVRHQGFIPWDDDTDVAMLREDYDRFLELAQLEMGDKYKILTTETDSRYTCSVTHLQRKGTKFVAEFANRMKCDLCIDLDIFPMENVAPDGKKAKCQAFWALFYGKLLFLCGTPYPVIPLKGIAGTLAKAVCFIAHYLLKLLHISPVFIYRRMKRAATRYNGRETEYVASFEAPGWPLDRKIRRKDIYPLKKARFGNMTISLANNCHEQLTDVYGDYMQIPPEEKRKNHMPYILQFENEDPVIFNGEQVSDR